MYTTVDTAVNTVAGTAASAVVSMVVRAEGSTSLVVTTEARSCGRTSQALFE